jgi:hypothetical protein
VSFTVGTQSTTATTDATGLASTTLKITQAPGAKTVTATYTPTATEALYTGSTTSKAFTVNPEDARTYYTGSSLFWTPSTSSNTATLTLSATIKDITAVVGDAAYDGSAGDIRNATVTFVNRDVLPNAVLCTAPIGLVNTGDTTVGTATCNASYTIQGTSGAQQFMLGIKVGNYYTRDDAFENAVIDVAQPIATTFITGGGHLVNSASAGIKAGDNGLRTNFGFNVKYNKSGTSLQGNINTIVRSGGRVYQVKGNSLTSLAASYCKADSTGTITANSCLSGPTSPCTTNATMTCPITATFNGKANIQDVTNPNAPVSIDGNATLQVNLTDRGEPGANDTIAFTVWNKNNALWFSSRWNGTTTLEQLLGGGNLVAH